MIKPVRIGRLMAGLAIVSAVLTGCAGNLFQAAVERPTPSHSLTQQQESLRQELRRVLVFSPSQTPPSNAVITLTGNRLPLNATPSAPQHPRTTAPVKVTIQSVVPTRSLQTTAAPPYTAPANHRLDDILFAPAKSAVSHSKTETDHHAVLPGTHHSQQPKAQLTQPVKITTRDTTAAPQSKAVKVRRHTVASGDTLSDIALKYMGKGSDWKIILAANPSLANPNQLRVGQSLLIPTQANVVTASNKNASQLPAGHTPHTVSVGDSLRSLAQRYLGEPELWHILAHTNPDLAPPYRIHPGQTLAIPTEGAAEKALLAIQAETVPTSAVGHTVRSGDTLGAIAQRYLGNAGLWVAVMAANPGITNPKAIIPGQVLVIPSTAMAHSPPKKPPYPDA